MITKKQIQMSETFLNSAVLAVSGGFQDAYTYFTRATAPPSPLSIRARSLIPPWA